MRIYDTSKDCLCGCAMFLHESSAPVGQVPKVWYCPGCGMEAWVYYRGFVVLIPKGRRFEESVGMMVIADEVAV